MAGQELLPENRFLLQTVGDDVVDIFQKNDVRFEGVEVRKKGAVPPRTKDKFSLCIPERTAFRIRGNGVGRRVLRGKPHSEAGLEAVFIAADHPGKTFANGIFVFPGHREMEAGHISAVPGIEGGLDEMLFQGRPTAIGVVMEFQESFGKASVVQPLFRQDEPQDRHGITHFHQVIQIIPLAGDGCLKIAEKGVPLQITEEGICTTLTIIAASPVKVLVPLAEHSAGGSGGRDEFHDLPRPDGLFIGLQEGRPRLFGDDDDPVSRTAGPVEADR